MGTPPPSTLTMPDLSVSAGTTIYLATIETIYDCPVSRVHFHISSETEVVSISRMGLWSMLLTRRASPTVVEGGCRCID